MLIAGKHKLTIKFDPIGSASRFTCHVLILFVIIYDY